MLKKANRISLTEQVVSQIEQLIESGQWSIGDKLPPEMELMKEFDVSRNTLREAIHALVHAGLLETKQGSGTIVRSASALGAAINRHISKYNLTEILEVRSALEKEAAEMAANNRTDKALLELEESMRQCQKAAENNNIDAFIHADITFHKTMVKAAGNQLLQDLYAYMTNPLYSSIHNIMQSNEPFHPDKKVHHELVKAIQDQDAEKAVSHVNEYIHTFKKLANTQF